MRVMIRRFSVLSMLLLFGAATVRSQEARRAEASAGSLWSDWAAGSTT